MDATLMRQQQDLCNEKHKNIDAKLDAHYLRFDDHEHRIDSLEKAQVCTETIVQNVCIQLKALTTALWWSFGLILTTTVGFIIWYIQSLPR